MQVSRYASKRDLWGRLGRRAGGCLSLLLRTRLTDLADLLTCEQVIVEGTEVWGW